MKKTNRRELGRLLPLVVPASDHCSFIQPLSPHSNPIPEVNWISKISFNFPCWVPIIIKCRSCLLRTSTHNLNLCHMSESCRLSLLGQTVEPTGTEEGSIHRPTRRKKRGEVSVWANVVQSSISYIFSAQSKASSSSNFSSYILSLPFPPLSSIISSSLLRHFRHSCLVAISSLQIIASMSAKLGLTPVPPSYSSPCCAFGLGNADATDEDEEEDDASHVLPERWDVVGLGQAMVDFSGVVNDEFLEKLRLDKGTRKVINHEERGRVLRAMDGCSYKAAAGGSLSNSLVALARLGGRPIGGPALNIGMAGSVGSDPFGGFYRTKLRQANVNFLSAPVVDGTTGTVIVLTTPDAQRTMLAYQGTSSTINYDASLAGIVSKTNILVIEGYLFEFPGTIRTIKRACEEAHRHGALVAITASDITCIEKHYDDFWEVIGEYADIVIGNSAEAQALCDFSSEESPVAATRYLSHFVPLISITDGSRGSYFGVKGEAIYVPPSPCIPVDTCGAGDAYASGVLYGILRGVSDLKGIGSLAAKVASTVVKQQGTRLKVHDAIELAEAFGHRLDRPAVSSNPITSL